MILFLFQVSSGHSQNLVPNPSFEIVSLPIFDNKRNSYEYEPKSGYVPFSRNIKAWEAGNEATPDLRIKDRDRLRDCEKRRLECDIPFKGQHSVGIITFLKNVETSTYREYIQVELKSPMEAGTVYNYSLWIAKERMSRLVSNNIGIHFSNKKHFQDNKNPLELKPQINIDTLINENKKQWVNIKGTFTPEENYTWVIIGNFFDNKSTKINKYKKFIGSDRTPPYAYYLIDEVKIWKGELNSPPTSKFQTITNYEKPLRRKNKTKVSVPSEALLADSIKLNFDIAKFELTSEHLVNIQNFFANIPSAAKYNFIIEGSTDFLGSSESNQILSEQRANSLKAYVEENHGDKIATLSFKGIGELSIDQKNNDKERGVREHRRVLMYINPVQTKVEENAKEKTLAEVPKKKKPKHVLSQSKPRRSNEVKDLANFKAGDKIVLQGLNFYPGKTDILKSSVPILLELLETLQANPSIKIEIGGHVCCQRNIGAATVQPRLSEERAAVVYMYLKSKGIDENRMSYKGYQFSQPLIYPEKHEGDRIRNRRVEIKVVEK